jgi:AraC-like DNA-binding protein
MTLIGQIILIISLFEIKINFINPNTIHKKTVERSESKIKKKNNLIINKIKELLEQKIYREEGLTITRLSSSIQTKEYLVRKAINEELGYANFNQFLNYYRIEEAKELLEKAPEMTMKEIAYHLGFANPSAFNRAFKNKMQKTPSEYKKSL